MNNVETLIMTRAVVTRAIEYYLNQTVFRADAQCAIKGFFEMSNGSYEIDITKSTAVAVEAVEPRP